MGCQTSPFDVWISSDKYDNTQTIKTCAESLAFKKTTHHLKIRWNTDMDRPISESVKWLLAKKVESIG
jgi:hypothetical protein